MNKKEKGRMTMLAAVICIITMMPMLTSCSDTTDNPVEVIDNKPFTYDSEIDPSVRPGDDFYRYALGQWLNSSNPSPSNFIRIEEELKTTLDDALATNADPLLVMLRSQADETLADDSRNVALLKERLQMLEQIETADQLYAAFGSLYQLGYSPLFRLIPLVIQGSRVAIGINAGGMTEEMQTLFKRDTPEKIDSLVRVYCQPLRGLGYSDERIAQIIDNAIELEKKEVSAYSKGYEMVQSPLCARRLSSEEDVNSRTELVLSMMGLSIEDIANHHAFWLTDGIIGLLKSFASAGDNQEVVNTFRDYMIYNVISQDAPFVPSVNSDSDRRAMLRTALQYNRYYKYRQLVEYYGYDKIYKQQCQDILERMREHFIQRIDNLDWMSPNTKAEARYKAKTMKFYIGYPEQWNDDMTPEANGDYLLATVTQLRQNAVETNKSMGGHTVDNLSWDFWASFSQFTTDNAFYQPAANALVILPAWIMRPRFDGQLSEATLYATSVTFGHEFCHGFDASGSKYDADGNIRDWWDPADKEAFQEKQQIMVDLFNQLEDYPGQMADGEKTLVENMADYGGVNLALECYKQRLTEQGFRGKQFDEQIKKFFLSYAQTWKNERELSLDLLKKYHEMDTHSSCHNRVNGMMRLQDDWYHLYDVKPTDKLYLDPKDRVRIW